MSIGSNPKSQTRDRIISASYRCFTKFGRRTTITDIASEARLTRRTLYKYFATRDEIIETILSIETAKIDSTLRRMLSAQSVFDDRLTDCILLSINNAGDAPLLRSMIASERFPLLSDRAENSVVLRHQMNLWRSIIEPALVSGDLAPDLKLSDVVIWITLAHHIILLQREAKHLTAKEARWYVRAFVVEPLLANTRHAGKLSTSDHVNQQSEPKRRRERKMWNRESFSEAESNIMRAARLCFERAGIKKTTMAQIANAAGISRRTLYRYFDSKEEIVSYLTIWESAAVNDKIRAQIKMAQPFGDVVTECLLLAFRISAEQPYLRAFAEEPALIAQTSNPSSLAFKVIRAQWSSLFDYMRRKRALATYLSVQEVVTWLYLGQALMHARINDENTSDQDLRHFVRRFIVYPILPAELAVEYTEMHEDTSQVGEITSS